MEEIFRGFGLFAFQFEPAFVVDGLNEIEQLLVFRCALRIRFAYVNVILVQHVKLADVDLRAFRWHDDGLIAQRKRGLLVFGETKNANVIVRLEQLEKAFVQVEKIVTVRLQLFDFHGRPNDEGVPNAEQG